MPEILEVPNFWMSHTMFRMKNQKENVGFKRGQLTSIDMAGRSNNLTL